MEYIRFVESLFDALPPGIRSTGFIAGGALRTYFDLTPLKDVDVFFRSEEDYLAAVAEMDAWGRYERQPDAGRTAVYADHELGIVNLIGFAYGTPAETLDRFDFRCCRLAAWLAQGEVVLHADPDSITDAVTKLLVVVNNNGTDRTLRRIAHYVNDYGYRLEPIADDGLGELPEDEKPAGACVLPPYVVRRIRSLPTSTGGY